MNLDHWTWPHQVPVPWGSPTAHFQVGSSGVKSIEADAGTVLVTFERHVLLFAHGGWGWAEAPAHKCDECGKTSESPAGLAAHKRSHRPNHRGAD